MICQELKQKNLVLKIGILGQGQDTVVHVIGY